VVMKEKGVSTLGGRKIWFDEDVLRLNADGRGRLLGEFGGHDRLLVITRSGKYRISTFDLENHFEDDLHILEKYNPRKVWSVVYWDADQNYYYVKRFMLEETEKLTSFISDNPESKLIRITEVGYPRFEINFGGKNKNREPEIVEVAEFIAVKSFRAKGKRLTRYQVELVSELESGEQGSSVLESGVLESCVLESGVMESEVKPEDRKLEKKDRIHKSDGDADASTSPEDKKTNGQMTLDL